MGWRIDLNADLGESFGKYTLGCDEAMLEVVTSANIACGFHAGDPDVMARTVRLAAEKGVAVGAHPGLPDLAGFGRRAMAVTPEEVFNMVVCQIGALSGFAKVFGTKVNHVKPHGALYHMAANDRALAGAIAEAVHSFDPGLILVAPWGSELAKAGEERGLRVAAEVFADRALLSDGRLVPRNRPDALVRNPVFAARRVVRMVKEGIAVAVDGTEIPVRADTVCVHGDHPGADEFARLLRQTLEAEGITVIPVGEDPA
jgi:5-oxoprolinase (ATP-hydrolysing) subunit A